jgi:hypothetical protein
VLKTSINIIMTRAIPRLRALRSRISEGEGWYYKNNSDLAIQFAAAGGMIYRKALAEGSNRSIPTDWLGSDLSVYYQAGFRPSP